VPKQSSTYEPSLAIGQKGALQLRDVGEFALIARIARAARRVPSAGVALGIGDDAALLPARRGETWVVSTDARVEGVHFRWSTDAPRAVGATALAAALSDLAAMGARPRGFTWALAAPGDLPLPVFDGVLRGLLDGARRYACPLVGGNLTRASETSLVLTVFGGSRRAARCAAARGWETASWSRASSVRLRSRASARSRAGACCAGSRCRGSRRAARWRGSAP